jgi:CheY-like chemotaxis protein
MCLLALSAPESAVERQAEPFGTRTCPMKKTVLIVEDNELNMKLFGDLLEAHGYATLKTGNGIEAIELARAHHPNLIIMDIQLPEVSGLDVTRWLKKTRPCARSRDRRHGVRHEGG